MIADRSVDCILHGQKELCKYLCSRVALYLPLLPFVRAYN